MSTRVSKSSKSKSIQTFTYYIPAPPDRKNGYREKEFDKIMTGIFKSGFELIELKTQNVSNGLFIIALLRAPSAKIAKLDENLDIQEKFQLAHTHASPDIILEDDDA